MNSCKSCGKTIITDPTGKVLVGCDHYPVKPKNDEDVLDFLKGFMK